MTRFVRSALLATAGLLALTTSCNVERTVAPKQTKVAKFSGSGASIVTPSVVISQVYGGGGNNLAPFQNDFVELFNPGVAPVTVTGWSVQYSSSAGTSWNVATLSGTIAAGGYYLVKEAAGAGAGVALPTADATGSAAMSATAGKVWLMNTTATQAVVCPTGPTVVDHASYGTGSSNCDGFGTTASLANTTAGIRNSGGCAYTGSMTADFTVATPTPRNTASPIHTCVVGGVPVSVTVAPATAGITTGGTQAFIASALDGLGNPASTTFTWTSSDNSIATIDASGVATGVAGGSVTITAKSANNVSGTATLNVTAVASHAGEVVISQIYGGGGNAGSTFKNDFIEVFNRSASPVSVDGWSVQQTSATGATYSVTPISGTIPAGGYYLVQESAGAAGTVDLPTPDATGTITMGATSGKVLLAQTTAAFTTACPTGNIVVDIASYGAGTNCGNAAPAPSALVADIRLHSGCTWAPNPTTDFVTGTPTPRNSASPTHSCVAGPLDHVTITGSLSVLAGSTTQLTADAVDVNENSVPGATVTWTTSDASIATVSATGLVTGIANTGAPATITATAVSGAITRTASIDVQVTTPGGINWVDISSSSSSFPPGFQTELFATAREAQNGTVIPATFTFEAVNPDIATVATVANTGSASGTTAGIVTGVAAPSDGSKPGIRVTATPTGGGTTYTFVTHPVTIEVPVTAPPSIYAVNDEFGDPTPAAPDHPNDMLIRRNQYVLSYNQSRGTPNWVSYELDARQLVAGADRCNCFAADPLLPPDKQILTSDYTNGGYDRGHMTRSADRTQANVDNAITFYLTNVVPQFGALNQGVWAQFENMLADSARLGGKAVYIITGPLYSASHGLAFIKGEGKVAIPDSTWKVALIGPRNGGNPFTHNSIQSYDDLIDYTLLAVNMRNHDTVGLRNTPPLTFQTTVDKIEQSTGYDILSLLGAAKQAALDYHDRKPVAQFSVSGATTEGSTLTFDASASTDPDFGRTDLGRAESLTYSWHFSDGTDATGAVVTHTVSDNGNFSATLTVTDAFGWPATSSTSVSITNVAPTATFFAPASVDQGSAFALSLTGASDPSTADVAAGFAYAFDCGDGAGYAASTGTSSVSCSTSVPGNRAVRGKVIDKDGGATEYSGNVTVNNVVPSVATFAGATLLPGETYSASGSFTDPGTDTWTATVNYGDGSGVGALALSAKTFSLSHTYAVAGTFTVTVDVSDGYSSGNRTATVVVLTQAQGTQGVEAMMDQLVASGAVSRGNANSLTSKLDAAIKQFQGGNNVAGKNQLNAALNEIDAMVQSGRLSPADAATLKAAIQRILNSL